MFEKVLITRDYMGQLWVHDGPFKTPVQAQDIHADLAVGRMPGTDSIIATKGYLPGTFTASTFGGLGPSVGFKK